MYSRNGRRDTELFPGLPWEWEYVGIPMGNPQIPIWDGNGNNFKPMGIPTCGFLWVFLWVYVGIPTEILWEWVLKFYSHGNPGYFQHCDPE